MLDMPVVSIIVPIYNVEKYLVKCIESLLNQTYKNIEIILVDDGATDNCPYICNEYSKKYSNIKVIHKINGGLSDARNAGMNIAMGEYLFFVDSDDYIHNQTIELLVRTSQKYKSDIVECGVLAVPDTNDNPFENKEIKFDVKIYNHDDAVYRILNYDFKIMVWNKLYIKKLFDDIRYPVEKLHEDEFTTPYVIDKCNRYCSISAPLYAYVQRENSIMNTKFNNRRLDLVEAQQIKIDYFNKKYNYKYNSIMQYHLFVACMELKLIMNDQYNGSNVESLIKELQNSILCGDSSITQKLKVIGYIFFSKQIIKHNKMKR